MPLPHAETYIPLVLERIGYDAGWADLAASWAADDVSIARVVRVDRGAMSVLDDDGPHRTTLGADVLRRLADDPIQAPCAGDWVVVRHWPDHRSTVEAVLPRRTALVRRTAGEQSHGQVLAANVDRTAVVVALHPEPVITRLERLLTFAWESGAEPLVVLTKGDLVGDAEDVADEVRRNAPRVEVVVTSVATGEGLDRLRAIVDGRRTLALIGSSGHGKSSLVNAMVGAEVLTTKAIREDGRGRHTSVRRQLVPLPHGGAVIDTPGLRRLGLIEAEQGLASTFHDIEVLAATCRFGDCSHREEPGCRVRAAIADGVLQERRLDAYVKLQLEIEREAQRVDARMRARRGRGWRRRPPEPPGPHTATSVGRVRDPRAVPDRRLQDTAGSS